MRVIQFNTTTSGGAAVAARRLHDALVESGISSRFCHLGPKRNTKPQDASYLTVNSQWKKTGSLRTWLIKRLQKIDLNRALKGRDPGLEFRNLVPELLHLDAVTTAQRWHVAHMLTGVVAAPFRGRCADPRPEWQAARCGCVCLGGGVD